MSVVRLRDLAGMGKVPESHTVSLEDANRVVADFFLYGNAFVVPAPEGSEATHVRVDPMIFTRDAPANVERIPWIPEA